MNARLLYLSSRPPHPHGKGDALTCHHYVRELARLGWDADVIALRWWNDRLGAELPANFNGSYEEVRVRPTDLTRPGVLRALVFEGWPVQAAIGKHAVQAALSPERLAATDVFYCHYLRTVLPAINGGVPGDRVVAGLQLTQAKNNEMLARNRASFDPRRWFGLAEARRCATVERELVDRVSAVVFTSPGDIDYLGLNNSPRAHVIPHGVALGTTPAANRSAAIHKVPIIAFSGSMRFPPNIEGIQWFVREVWPEITRRHPKALLRILGRDPHPTVAALVSKTIEVTGAVPSIADELRFCALAIAPIRAAAGMQNKVLEAADAGLPIVATPAANEATALPSDCLIEATTPQEWIDAVSRILDDPELAASLGARAREYVVSSWSWESRFAPLNALLEAVDEN